MPDPANLALAMALPPERAIEYFQAKGLRISNTWRDMVPEAHARAFTVAGVLRAEALQDIRTAMDRAIADGRTFDEFVRGLKAKLKTQGWWGRVPADPETGEVLPGRAMTPHRLRTVFQTNTQSAYMAGRYKAQLENADQRPYWKYVAILDSRTRPRHRSLNGRIFRYDDPIWQYIYPPNGYNCRCRVQALSEDEFQAEGGSLSVGNIETIEVDLGPRGGKVSVTGYRDPVTNEFLGPDPGFDSNPGAGTWGLDVALARRTAQLQSRELRSQVWQALNNSPQRLAQFHRWTNATLDAGRAGHSAQVIGFVDEPVADFMRTQRPDVEPVRVVAITEKRLVHADSAKHRAGGIALTRDGYLNLPGLVARPDAVYFDTAHGNFAFVRELEDGVIYMALDAAEAAKKVGQIDAVVNAFRLDAQAAKRLKDAQRYIRMGAEGGR